MDIYKKSVISGSYGYCILIFEVLTKKSGCTILQQLHQQYMNNPIVLGHHQYLVLSIFLSNCSHSNGCVVQSHCGFILHLLKTKDPMDGGAW